MTQFDATWLREECIPLLFKLSRANDLSDQVSDALMKFGDGKILEMETIERGGKSVCHLRKVFAPPPSVGLLFGDAINQLRAALDHAVLMQVEAERGDLLPIGLAKLTAFPVCRDPKGFKDWCSRLAKKIPELAMGTTLAARLESLQPYHPTQIDVEAPVPAHDSSVQLFLTPVAPDGTTLVEHHPLIGLAEWSNADKHRRLNVAVVRSLFQGVTPDPAYHPTEPQYEWLAEGRELKPGMDMWAVASGSRMVADIHAYPAIQRPQTGLWRPIVAEINLYQRWVGEVALPIVLGGDVDGAPLPPDRKTDVSVHRHELLQAVGEGYAWRSASQRTKIAAALSRGEQRAAATTKAHFEGLPGQPEG